MHKAFRASAVLALTTMLGSVATPGVAGRGWYGGGHGGWGSHHHRHRGHDDGFGAFLGAAAVIGAVAIIASSTSRKAKTERAYSTELPPEDDRYDERAEGAEDSAPYSAAPDAANVETASEDAAVDACALAAQEEASQDGGEAEVRDITGTQPIEGGWTVDGTVEQGGQSHTRQFSCTWRNGRVADVVLDRDEIALR